MTDTRVGRASLIVGRELPRVVGEPLPWRRGHPVDPDDPPPGSSHGLPLVLPAPPASAAAPPSGLFSRPPAGEEANEAPKAAAPAPAPHPPWPATPARVPEPRAAPGAAPGSSGRRIAGALGLLALLALFLWWRRRR